MIDVMIITYNEALNLPRCLAALRGWTRRVFVIDSGSTDGTQDIARSMGAEVVHHDWAGYAAQKNWGLANLPLEADWILLIDADEVITPAVRQRLMEIASKPADQVPENGFFINRLTYFLGRPIRHCGYYPSWNMRFFKRGRGRYEHREVHEHVIIENPVGYVKEPMLHDDLRGLEHYMAKHNRYSTLEAIALFEEMHARRNNRSNVEHPVRSAEEGDLATSRSGDLAIESPNPSVNSKDRQIAKSPNGSQNSALTRPALRTAHGQGNSAPNITADTARRRWVKLHVMPHLPFPGLGRFLYMYVARLGFLDGRAGLEFSRFISIYDSLVALKLRELRRHARRRSGEGLADAAAARILPRVDGLATTEGAVGTWERVAGRIAKDRVPSADEGDLAIESPNASINSQDRQIAKSPNRPQNSALTPPAVQHTQMQPEASPWSLREKVGRAIWMLLGRPVFRMSFHNWYEFRARLLRLFGARIGKHVAIRPSVNIEVPWMIEVDDDVTIGDHAILYSLGQIRIGKRAIISQYAHLCAGTHDYTDHTFRLMRTPVTIGDDVWVGADAFIGPGVNVGSLSVVGARSSTYKDLPERRVCVGNPAKPVKERLLR